MSYAITFFDSFGEEQRVTLKVGINPTFWVNDVLEKVPLSGKVPIHVSQKFSDLFTSDLESDSKFPNFIVSLEEYLGVENCEYFVFSSSEVKLLWFMFYNNKLCTKQTLEHINERVTNRNKNDPEEMEEEDEDVISVLTKFGSIAKCFSKKFSQRLAANKCMDFMQQFIKAINEFFRRISLHLVFEFANDESIFMPQFLEVDDVVEDVVVEDVVVEEISVIAESGNPNSRVADLEKIVLTQSRKLQEQNREILAKTKEVKELENKLGNAFSDFMEVATKNDELEQKLKAVAQPQCTSEVASTMQKQIDFWKSKVSELRAENANLKATNDKLQEKINFPE